jgi:hypothetical protein
VARNVVEYNTATARQFSIAVGLISLNKELRVCCLLRVVEVKCDKIAVYRICI